jgi:hypothetical protein
MFSTMEPLGGIAEADAKLGRAFPLPGLPLPLTRWVEVCQLGDGAEVEWNLDDSRDGAPGRLALYAGPTPAPEQLPGDDAEEREGIRLRRTPLAAAQPSLRPVVELSWAHEGLQLRLTAQGPWDEADLLALAHSVRG